MRKQANQIDSWDSPFKAIVSVLMLKEGWDVRNVTTIVGLRAYAAESNILPEQTLGRGLRRMYFGKEAPETVSVMGTPAFMEFVESIQSEGVELERVPMGGGTQREDSLVVEVETTNPEKDFDILDIAIPRLSRRFQREYKNLDSLDASVLQSERLPLRAFTLEETREIVFKTMLDGEAHHTVSLDGTEAGDGRSVIAFFRAQLLKDLRLVGGYDILYGQVKFFVRERLFEGPPVEIDDPVVLRNLSESAAAKRVFDTFKTAINALTVQDSGSSRIEDFIRLRDVRPFRTQAREWLPAKRSIFNRIVGEANAGGLELRFAAWLDRAPGVASFAKNYLAVGFKLDYVKTDGDLSTYTPDFIVKDDRGDIWIIETKGREELDLPAQDGPARAVVRGRDCGKPRRRRAGVPLRLRRSGRVRQAPPRQPRRAGNDVSRVQPLAATLNASFLLAFWIFPGKKDHDSPGTQEPSRRFARPPQGPCTGEPSLPYQGGRGSACQRRGHAIRPPPTAGSLVRATRSGWRPDELRRDRIRDPCRSRRSLAAARRPGSVARSTPEAARRQLRQRARH